MHSDEYNEKINRILESLGITCDLHATRLPLYLEAQELTIAEVGSNGNLHLMTPPAAKAWHSMKEAAAKDRLILEIVSAFRSIEDQVDIIREKIGRAMPIETILTLSAPPGFSEHHTGCAVDINTPGCVAREEAFENTDAFRWLTANAHRFGFTLSYPRGNRFGFIYEPWHWFFDAAKMNG
ncbi:MAG TPA: M15 family metallopeptidase [Burkholderiaceae bacterium]|jgi:D-alanyl-D-alanine carboxypeptidase